MNKQKLTELGLTVLASVILSVLVVVLLPKSQPEPSSMPRVGAVAESEKISITSSLMANTSTTPRERYKKTERLNERREPIIYQSYNADCEAWRTVDGDGVLYVVATLDGLVTTTTPLCP